jgi:histidinol dehydrogenase
VQPRGARAAFAAGVSRVQLCVNGAAIDPAYIEVELAPWLTPITANGVKLSATQGAVEFAGQARMIPGVRYAEGNASVHAVATANDPKFPQQWGVQAIGAMAYGTTTINAVDKIYGPGNAYVCEAKRQVFGTVGVDSLPGPSEVMIIADETANPSFAAADLLAQAEHGSGREKIYLLGTSAAIIAAIAVELRTQLQILSRSEKTQRVLEDGFLALEVKSLAHAAEIANYVAPEHLELLVADAAAKKLTADITTAGAIMIGNYTPTALGDFVAGPSHVLPTGRAGRFFSGLRVADFLRRTSVVHYDRASVKKAEPIVAAFAAMEKLDAHGRSVRIRA